MEKSVRGKGAAVGRIQRCLCTICFAYKIGCVEQKSSGRHLDNGSAAAGECCRSGLSCRLVVVFAVECADVYIAPDREYTGVYFPDANVIATGDIMNSNHTYQQVDFFNGGDIRGMIRASNDWLRIANDQTKVVTGHGPLANKKVVEEYNAMVKKARELVEKLVLEGKTEEQVLAADPLKDLTQTWKQANDPTGKNFTKQVYNSFKRS